MKRTLSTLCLTLSLSLALLVPVTAAEEEAPLFPRNHPATVYSDVAADAWYQQEIQVCSEAALLQGSADGLFFPDDPITMAEVAVVAARIQATVQQEDIPFPSEPEASSSDQEKESWYLPYLTYLETYHISVENPAQEATRQDFFGLLAKVLPDPYLLPINSISTLPDTTDETIFLFYNAGILTGVNPYGTFAGDKTLSRAEAATMIARIIQPSLRRTFTPRQLPEITMETKILCLAAQLDPLDTVITFSDGNIISAAEYLPYLVEESVPAIQNNLREWEYQDLWNGKLLVGNKTVTAQEGMNRHAIYYFTFMNQQTVYGGQPSVDAVLTIMDDPNQVKSYTAQQIDVKTVYEAKQNMAA